MDRVPSGGLSLDKITLGSKVNIFVFKLKV